MSQSAPTLPLPAAPAAVRFDGLWLFSPRVDVSLLLFPLLLMLASVWLADLTGEGPGGYSRTIGRWTSQYIFFNGTHVILTFLLLGVRRELLHTTPTQPRLLVGGSAAVFTGVLSLLLYSEAHAPRLGLMLAAITHVLALHHTLSQVKGLWALHGLRARAAGAPPLSEAERKLQRTFVPLALLLVVVRSLAMPVLDLPDARPLVDIGQVEDGSLPLDTRWLLLAVWGVFVARLVLAMRGPAGASGPRRLYVMGHAAVVAIYLVWPLWGGILSAGIHGLEYFFLTGRMLEPTAREPGSALRGGWVWVAMLAVMLPLILVGVANGPFVDLADTATGGRATAFLLRQEPLWTLGVHVTNAIVLTHYFADAFLYRFRIPRVREVTLARLGL
jgi:hypothetical protein